MTYGICTGCNQLFFPGPYFKRRVVRHLRLLFHNHDAVELITYRRDITVVERVTADAGGSECEKS